MQENKNTPNLYTVKQFIEKHPAFTHGGMRHLIFKEHKNGFATCIVRIGRRVLIIEDKFFEWVELQQAA